MKNWIKTALRVLEWVRLGLYVYNHREDLLKQLETSVVDLQQLEDTREVDGYIDAAETKKLAAEVKALLRATIGTLRRCLRD